MPSPFEFNRWLTQLIEDRRSATRFPREPGTEYASIVAPIEQCGVIEVSDESLGGLGLVVDGIEGFEVDQRLEVIYAGEKMQMVIRHLSERTDGRWTLGLQEIVAPPRPEEI